MAYLDENGLARFKSKLDDQLDERIEEQSEETSVLLTGKLNIPANVPQGKFLQTNENGEAVWGEGASSSTITTAVNNWLADNVAGGSTIAVDTSLNVTGAAAESKTVGDKLNNQILVQDSQPVSADNKIWVKETPQTEVEVPSYTEFTDLNRALSSEDAFVNDTLSYINYGYDEPYYKAGNPSGSSWLNKIGVKRDRMVVVLNKSELSQYDIRVKISGDVEFAANNSRIDAWTSGITLEGEHTYRAVTKLLSGTSSNTEQGDGLVPGISVYKCGTHSNIGEITRTPGLTIRTFTVEETAQYNLAIYIGSTGTYYTNAKLLITLEDVTESKLVNIEEQVAEIDENMYRIGKSLDHLFYTEEISFDTSDWRTGYYHISNGNYVNSVFYICTANNFTISKSNAARLTAKAPEGYYIAAFEYDGNGVYIKRYGNMKDGTNTIDIVYTDGHNYRLAVGRFANKDSEEYITSEFIGQIKVSVYELKLPDVDTKKDRTGDFEWFTVTVNRPLAFGGEEVIDPQEEQEIECVLRLPSTYTKAGKPTRMILACHGAHGYVNSANNKWYTADWKAFMDYLLAAGYAVFDANVLPLSTGTDPNQAGFALGSPLYVNVLKKAYDYIVYNYNIYDKIFTHGTSMGGVGATAFAHAYPQIVLAESSFAGRNVLRYLWSLHNGEQDERIAISYGYESLADLASDHFSHIEGAMPDLSVVKYADGAAQIPPDRETHYDDWLAYYSEIANLGRNDDPGIWMGQRRTPYKAWNSWADNEAYTKLITELAKIYNRGGSCPFFAVNYETGTHTEMSYGQINDMRDQLIAWYKRWE